MLCAYKWKSTLKYKIGLFFDLKLPILSYICNKKHNPKIKIKEDANALSTLLEKLVPNAAERSNFLEYAFKINIKNEFKIKYFFENNLIKTSL